MDTTPPPIPSPVAPPSLPAAPSPKKRGCLWLLGVSFLALFALGFIGTLVSPPKPKDTPSKDAEPTKAPEPAAKPLTAKEREDLEQSEALRTIENRIHHELAGEGGQWAPLISVDRSKVFQDDGEQTTAVEVRFLWEITFNPSPVELMRFATPLALAVLHSGHGSELTIWAMASFTDDLGKKSIEPALKMSLPVSVIRATEWQNLSHDRQLAVWEKYGTFQELGLRMEK